MITSKFITNINEITTDHLVELVQGIKVAKHYALVAVIHECRTISLHTASGDEPIQTNVKKYILCTDSEQFEVGDNCVLEAYALERCPAIPIPDNNHSFRAYAEILKTEYAGVEYKDLKIGNVLIGIEFKVIPVNTIMLAYPN